MRAMTPRPMTPRAEDAAEFDNHGGVALAGDEDGLASLRDGSRREQGEGKGDALMTGAWAAVCLWAATPGSRAGRARRGIRGARAGGFGGWSLENL